MKKNIVFAVCLFIVCMLINIVFAAELCITIPDHLVTRVQDGVCGQYRYDPNTDGTQNAFVKAKTKQFIRETVLAYEYEQSKAALVPDPLDMEE